MRSTQIRLYSFVLPLLPVLFSFSQIPKYIRGTEFRAILAELLVQVTSGVVDAVIITAVYQAFGVPLG
jgi:hypothetical protein